MPVRPLKTAPIIILFIAFAASYAPVISEGAPSCEIIWPLRDYTSISSSFGEYRPGRVHMGIDIRTFGATGVPALAIADGYVSRIKVKPTGYGRALYLTLEDGRTAVYAHLESFVKPVQEYILSRQWETRSFEQDLFPQPGQFSFKKGDVVCYTGKSGTKHPHLHFEIRRGNWAHNPFRYGLVVKDSEAPIIRSLAVIPLGAESEVNGDCLPVVFTVNSESGKHLKLAEKPEVFGRVGLAVQCYDRTGSASYFVNAYEIALLFDGEEIFTARMDSCDYFRNLMMDLDRDPYLNRNGWGNFQRLFIATGNEMPFYTGGGILDTRRIGAGAHNFIIRVEDFSGNGAEIDGELDFIPTPALTNIPAVLSPQDFAKFDSFSSPVPEYSLEFFDKYIRVAVDSTIPALIWSAGRGEMLAFELSGGGNILRLRPPAEISGFNYLATPDLKILESWRYVSVTPQNGGVIMSPDSVFKITFPPGGVYDTLFAAVRQVSIPQDLSAYDHAMDYGYKFEPQWVPLRMSAELVWNGSEGDTCAGIFFFKEGKPAYLGTGGESARIRGSCLNLETFYIIHDDDPPPIILSYPRPNSVIKERRPKFSFSAVDTLSGIDYKTLKVTVDGGWALSEYDPPRDSVYASLREPLQPGRHRVCISIADKMGNLTAETYSFTIKSE